MRRRHGEPVARHSSHGVRVVEVEGQGGRAGGRARDADHRRAREEPHRGVDVEGDVVREDVEAAVGSLDRRRDGAYEGARPGGGVEARALGGGFDVLFERAAVDLEGGKGDRC